MSEENKLLFVLPAPMGFKRYSESLGEHYVIESPLKERYSSSFGKHYVVDWEVTGKIYAHQAASPFMEKGDKDDR